MQYRLIRNLKKKQISYINIHYRSLFKLLNRITFIIRPTLSAMHNNIDFTWFGVGYIDINHNRKSMPDFGFGLLQSILFPAEMTIGLVIFVILFFYCFCMKNSTTAVYSNRSEYFQNGGLTRRG